MQKLTFILGSFFMLTFGNCQQLHSQSEVTAKEDTKIQVAILLDVSGSMNGLIDQAKSRLWNIVNTLTTLKYQGKTPVIEIALYEYGNSGLSEKSGYIRQATPLTTDLDLISEKLFALQINGSQEYCGMVINDAIKTLEWGGNKTDMKLIYIAGNEEFNQGAIDYKVAIGKALEKGIYVNTIYCGDSLSGIRELWLDGAAKGQGKYFNINSNAEIVHITTPYDIRISVCNIKLNNTYISYGAVGNMKKMNQAEQDGNAATKSSSVYAERIVSKSKSAYKNDSWDLVDKVKEDNKAVSKIKKEDWPKEFQNKTEKELNEIVAQKAKERETIQKEIVSLSKQRQEYIDKETQKGKTKQQDDLGNAINSSIVDLAKTKGYEVTKE